MIIDFRVRPEIEEFVSITDNDVFRSYAQGRGYDIPRRDVGDLVANMDEHGIDYGVLEGRDIQTTFGWSISNDLIAEVAQRSGGRLIPFAGVDPHKGMNAVREVRRCVAEHGFRGVAMDPYMHKLPADHRLYYPVYATCVELDLPVVLTSGWAFRMPGVVMEDASPLRIDRVATDLPELKIVMSHGGYPFIREMVTVAYRHENVYFEWSGMEQKLASREYVEAANDLIPEKMLYASAFPFIPFETALSRYADLSLDDEVRPGIMGGNAARLLGIPT